MIWEASKWMKCKPNCNYESTDKDMIHVYPCLQFLETCSVNQSRGIKRPFSMAHLIHSLRPSAPGPSVHRRQLQRRSDQRHCSGVMVAALSIDGFVQQLGALIPTVFSINFSP